MSQEKIGIIGGSIAGLASAILFQRAGLPLHVFEKRDPEQMSDLGAGIVLPEDLIDQLKREDLFDLDFRAFPLEEREFLRRDSKNPDQEETIGVIPIHAFAIHWGLLYQQLAKRIAKESISYRKKAVHLERRSDGFVIEFQGGAKLSYHTVLCADGYRSLGRKFLYPEVSPQFTDYTCWQGICSTEDAAVSKRMEKKVLYYVYETGVLLIYEIPSLTHRRSITWFLYETIGANHPFVRDQKVHANIYKDRMTREYTEYLHQFAQKNLPSFAREIIQKTEEPFTHAIYDTMIPSYYSDRVAVIGDAGILLRPHIGSGATKALQDSLRFMETVIKHPNEERAWKQWAQECQDSAAHLYGLSREFGKFLVSNPPDWNQLNQMSLNQKWNEIVKGYNWYQHR